MFSRLLGNTGTEEGSNECVCQDSKYPRSSKPFSIWAIDMVEGFIHRFILP